MRHFPVPATAASRHRAVLDEYITELKRLIGRPAPMAAFGAIRKDRPALFAAETVAIVFVPFMVWRAGHTGGGNAGERR
jgi:hypothetical protein